MEQVRARDPAGIVTDRTSGVATHARALPRSPMERETPWDSPELLNTRGLLSGKPSSSL